jgi:hypothetical protein
LNKHHFTLRQYTGALFLDIPRYYRQLFLEGKWKEVRNRQDNLELSSDGLGVRYLGKWTSSLWACEVYPHVGRALMRQALREWPIRFSTSTIPTEKPDVSFVIPFRGKDRLPLLQRVVQSVLGQRDISVECIVVEQGSRRDAEGLPPCVRYIHLPCPDDPEGWHKSWAFNVGVSEARADIVICHDADILVPFRYGWRTSRRLRKDGYEVSHPQRFLFRLNPKDTIHVVKHGRVPDTAPEAVWQNWKGGTLAIRRDAYFRIGGFDERFVDWGGEDDEFFDRCRVLKQYDFGYLPFIHLWHEPQPTKSSPVRDRNLNLLAKLLQIPPEERIRELKGRSVLKTRNVGVEGIGKGKD